MEVIVYNSEKFERSKRRYVIFATVFACILLLSIIKGNYVGAVLLFFLLGGYFYYSAVHIKPIKMTLETNSLKIGDNMYPRTSFVGYVLEMNAKTQLLKNVVFITSKGHSIYTFDDTPEHMRDFLVSINDYLPMLESYEQTGFEKLVRKLQL